MEHQKIRRQALQAALWIIAAGLALRFLGPVLLPFGAGLLTALAAEPLIVRLQQRLRLPRWAAAGISVAVVYGLLILLLSVLCKLLWRELTAFVRALPDILQSVSGLMTQWEAHLLSLTERFPEGIAAILTKTITETVQDGSAVAEKLYEWLFSLVSGLLKSIPDLLLFLLTAVLTAGFLLLRIPYPLLLGLVIALIDALPALGTGLILIPWALFMFLQRNTFLGTGLLLLYGVAALIRTALEPRLLGKQMGLDPLLTLLALYGGYRFLGIWGMILFPIGAMVIRQFWNHIENRTAD